MPHHRVTRTRWTTSEDVTTMTIDKLSFNTRKSLCNHLGELAGAELAEFLLELKARIESVERNKVEITKIVPDASSLAE